MAERDFTVGETVHLRARVAKAGTRIPYSPQTVRLTSMSVGGAPVTLPDVADFTKVAEGEFVLVVQTALLAPAVYDFVVTVSDGPDAVRLLTGTFVLNAL